MLQRLGLFILEKVLLFLASKVANDWINERLEKIEASKRLERQKAAQEKMKEVMENPDSTVEERAKAYAKYINTR